MTATRNKPPRLEDEIAAWLTLHVPNGYTIRAIQRGERPGFIRIELSWCRSLDIRPLGPMLTKLEEAFPIYRCSLHIYDPAGKELWLIGPPGLAPLNGWEAP